MFLPTLYARGKTDAILEWQMEVQGDRYRSITGQKDGNLFTQAFTVCLGKNQGKANETSPEAQALKEAQSKWEKKKKEGYFEDITRIDDFVFVQPQLLQTYKSPLTIEKEKETIAKMPVDKQEKALKDLKKFEKRHARLVKHFNEGKTVWVDDKYDGVRDIISSRGMYTRRGEKCIAAPHIFEAAEFLFNANPSLHLDGELYNHDLRDRLNKINSLAAKKKPTYDDLEESRNTLLYYVYDGYGFEHPKYGEVTEETPFSIRKKALKDLIVNIPYVILVESTEISSIEELDARHEDAILRGMEGTVIKYDTEYEHDRSDNSWKRKDFLEKEFKIVKFHLGDGKKSTMAAKATALLPDGREFDTNIKGDFEYLTELWTNQGKYLNRMGTVRFLKYSEYGIPLIGYLINFRND